MLTLTRATDNVRPTSLPQAGHTRIERPSSESGRPGSRGYNLRDALGWPTDKYSAVCVGASYSTLYVRVLIALTERDERARRCTPSDERVAREAAAGSSADL